MKRFFPVMLSLMLISLGIFAGCAENYYQVPENHCIVGIGKEFTLYSESENEFCKPIAENIKGVEKFDSYCYYSVIKGADYTICVNNFVDDDEWYGNDIDSIIIQTWWQGYVISGFVKNYSYYSGNENEEFFKTDYKQMYGNISVTFTENCTVSAQYEQYLNVGGIFAVVKKDIGYFDTGIDDFLNTDGSLNDLSGFYYLLLKEEVCVHQDAWITNLEVCDYTYEYLHNGYGNNIRAEFTTSPPAVADDEEWVLYQICRTYSGKYFINSPLYAGSPQGFTMPIREHELKLTFET